MDSETPPPMSRLMGGTELSWWRSVPGGTGITVLALLLSRPIPPLLLQKSLHTIQNAHPILRSTIITSSDTTPSISITPSFIHHQTLNPSQTSDLLTRILPAHPDPPSISPFHALLEHEMNQNPWSESHPENSAGVFFATVYEMPEPGWSVVALRFHTAVCDRTGGVQILKELLRLMGGVEREEEGTEGEVILAVEDLIRKEDSWKPFWARGRDLIGYSLNGLRASGLPFEDAGSDRSSEVVRLVMDAGDTRRLLSACEAKGVKLCAAISAAGLVATYSSKHHEDNQPETFSIVTLIDCRKFLDPVLDERSIGFYHSAIINTHTVSSGEGLWEVAMRCHKSLSNSMSNKKHLADIGELNFLMCKAIENPHLTPSSSLRTALISVFDQPLVSDSSDLQQALGVEDYVGCASVHGVGPSIAVFDTIREGRLDCACVYPSPLHSRKQIGELVERMKRILVEGSHVDEGEEVEI